MIFLVPREERLPTHAEREIEAGMNLELILRVEEVLPADRIAARLAENDAHGVEGAEQKVSVWVARPGICESGAAGLGELVIQDPIHVMHLVAPFEGVPATDPAHGIPKMPVLILLLVRIYSCKVEASLRADRNSLSIDAIGDGDSQAFGSVLLIGIIERRGMQEIECRLIQQARAERICTSCAEIVNVDAPVAADKRLDVACSDDLPVTILIIVAENRVLAGVEKVTPEHVAVVARWLRIEAHVAAD